jgi:outer membrane immunogenic protein
VDQSVFHLMKEVRVRRLICIACLLWSSNVWAETRSFTGPVAGIEAGVFEHHFFLETDPPLPNQPGRYFRSWNVGASVFGGYDIAVADDVRVGVEISAITGGSTNTARSFGPVQQLSLTPRWGYRAVVRAGATLNDRALIYVTGGYGGDRYRTFNPSNVAGVSEWRSSFVVGTGVEIRASSRVGVRLDLKHVDNSSYQLLLGIPVRF